MSDIKVKSIENFVKNLFSDDNSGHDWMHINRVRGTALYLAKKLKIKDIAIIECASLLHEFFDYKFFKKISIAQSVLLKLFIDAGFTEHESNKILLIAKYTSWSLSYYKIKECPEMIELDIVQDADRLDSIGAIGICRNIIYGTSHNEILYNSNNKINGKYNSFTNYRTKKTDSTIDYTVQRSLKVYSTLKTDIAQKIGKKRHFFILKFIEQFKNEWYLISN